jgi:CheY-like chemotaxis protein
VSNTILVVQDVYDQRESTCKSLEEKGYQTIGVGSVKEALSLLSYGSEAIRLVLTEQQLPDYSGHELKKRLEDLPGGKVLPVVFLDKRIMNFIEK